MICGCICCCLSTFWSRKKRNNESGVRIRKHRFWGRCKTILQRPQVISKSEKVRGVVPLRDEFYSFPKEIPYLFLINFYLLPGRVACCNTPKTVLSHSQRDFVPDQSIFSQGCLVHHKKKCCKTGAKSPEKGLWFLMRTQQKAGSSTFQKKNPVK